MLFLDENKTQSQKAPEGASRCRVLTSGISKVPVGGSESCGSSRIGRDKQESRAKVKAMRTNDRMTDFLEAV
ncbi:hypothetical protein [Rhizobium leguminosarum]|uniref:hypothetical protein n=1 Tax=Rhizobium leguminosarum TaxID=384 RepID=UPI001441E55F|nr:hypothetical protein [Rhizobium leguminosarum]